MCACVENERERDLTYQGPRYIVLVVCLVEEYVLSVTNRLSTGEDAVLGDTMLQA